MTQPLCRYCGKKIGKWTIGIYFVEKLTDFHQRENAKPGHYSRYIVGKPTTKAEAQRLVNMTIVSVRRTTDPWAKHQDVYIAQASAWDGESYVDAYFCNKNHAKDFGYLMAKGGHATTTYMDAKAELAVEETT